MKTKFLLICLLFTVSECFSIAAKAQAVNVGDSLALVDLFNSTKGRGWRHHLNWLNGPVNTWFGITVGGTRVTRVELERNRVNGIIPSSYGNLTALHYLYLNDNQLSGPIPTSICNLVNLYELYLYNNQLSDSIPSSIGKFTKLQKLYLFQNQLTGSIPLSIGNLVNIMVVLSKV